MKKLILILPIVGLLAFSPLLGLAQVDTIDLTDDAPVIADLDGLMATMQTLINAMFWFLMALTVVFVIYAAYLFLTGGQDQEKIDKARRVVIYAIVAVVVAMLAQGLFRIVLNFLGE